MSLAQCTRHWPSTVATDRRRIFNHSDTIYDHLVEEEEEEEGRIFTELSTNPISVRSGVENGPGWQEIRSEVLLTLS